MVVVPVHVEASGQLWVSFLRIVHLGLFFPPKTGFLCSFGACPETSLVEQAGFELTEIRLLLSPKCWD